MTPVNLPTRPRILLVDDETESRTMLAMTVDEEGYDVSHAASGKDAIRLQRENPFNLVIIELILKDKDGFETLTELRRQSAPTKFIATAKSSWMPPEHFLQMARQLGAHTALSKPFQHEEMLDAVRNALK
jgi:DNA-binding response OmpR family regulator